MEIGSIITIALYVVAGLIGLSLFFGAIVIVPEKHVKLITLLGKYTKSAGPGLNFKWPLIGGVAHTVSLAIQQDTIDAETITSDKVSVHPKITVQYEVIPGSERESYYNIANLGQFIGACVHDAVRSTVPEMTLDECFHNKEKIGQAVKAELETKLNPNGYRVLSVLVTEVDFDENVKKEMNRINAAQRAQVAAQAEAEANRIKEVTAAKASAEAMELQGKGIANQRQAIIAGLRESVEDFQSAVPGSTPAQAMEMVVLVQYMDMMRDVAAKNAKIIMLPSGPSAVGNLREEIMQGFLVSQETASTETTKPEAK